MESKVNKVYECRTLKTFKKNGKTIAIEWENETVYLYEYDGEKLLKTIIPTQHFFEILLKGDIENDE